MSIDGILDLYFGGHMEAGYAMSGQVAGRIEAVLPVREILETAWRDCLVRLRELGRSPPSDRLTASDSFKTPAVRAAYGAPMTPRFDVIGIVVADMAASLAFYRRLGLDVPADADTEPHVEASLPGGMRMAWDTDDTIRSFDPSWTPSSGGHDLGWRSCATTRPRSMHVTRNSSAAGHQGHLAPWDAFWGQRYAIVDDPDGNAVDLFAPLPAGSPRLTRAPRPSSPSGTPVSARTSSGEVRLVRVARSRGRLRERDAGAASSSARFIRSTLARNLGP